MMSPEYADEGIKGTQDSFSKGAVDAQPKIINELNDTFATGGRVKLSLGSKGISWVARRIQDINKLIKSKKAGPEDFLDEIQLLEKAEELNLTEGQVNQILKQQQQQRMDNYRKLPIQGEPAAKSRLPIDDIMNNYATGGRVGLDKGGKPKNPSRRTFLKGAGALGLAVAAFGTGALKLAKTLKTKTALEILAKPAAGQPEWFAPLVDKIITKGIYTKSLDKADSISGTYTFKEGDQTLKLIKTKPEPFTNALLQQR